MTLSASDRGERARLRRNCVIAECLRHIGGLAPSVDAAGRLGQSLAYRKGGTNGEGKGRHFPLGGYRDLAEQWRQANLQGCPREVRLLLAAPHCSDLDFVNSLPTVASQLDALGLCSSSCLVALRDYYQNRDRWFEAIADHHSIPLRTPTGMTKEEAVKALPIRLVHGGNYGE